MKVELPPSTKKFRLALVAGVVAFLCLVFFAFRFSTVSNLEELWERESEDVRKIQRNIENGENLETQLTKIERLSERILERTVIPEDASVNKAYFYQFESPGLEIVSVEQRNLEEPEDGDPWTMRNFGRVEFTIVALGSFTNVLNLAYQIRGGPKLVRVTALSILPEGAFDQRRIDLTIEAVSIKEQEEDDD